MQVFFHAFHTFGNFHHRILPKDFSYLFRFKNKLVSDRKYASENTKDTDPATACIKRKRTINSLNTEDKAVFLRWAITAHLRILKKINGRPTKSSKSA
ncbi:hypothetical protein [Fictibacillus sp. NRS-1165]|uniref:hypothetical protein n=1 Tax=Fictibacillus sp. NRS-1165 TaxID=3144463 RepID=UPI003D2378A2